MLENRRDFLKTAAASTAGVLGAMGLGATTAEARPAKKAKYDLIIAGAGCGGLVCGIRAAELGLKPLVLEKMPMPAGNAIYAAGFLLGINTSFQKAKGVPPDTVEAFYKDMMTVSQQQAIPALTRKVAEDCTKLLEWLHSSCGVNFSTGAKLVWPQLTRSHLVVGETKPGGAQLIKNLLTRAKALGVECRFSTKVISLLADPKTGSCCGVRVKSKKGVEEIHSRAGVVIATGGFSANQALITAFCGSAAAKMPIRGSRIVAGENITLTAPFLPKVMHVDQYHCGPIHGPTGANPLNIVNNGVCVNKEGKRFTNEGQTYVQMSRDVAAMTPDNWAYMVCDQTTRDLPILKNDWDSYARLGAPVFTGNTIETVHPVEKAPFYIVPFQGGMTATFGGPVINTNGQVLDTENQPIEGLFAAGNACGGIFYDNYVGGAQLTAAGVFGLAIAEYVKANLK